MLDACRAVQEVPLAHRALLALHDRNALAGEDQEVFLYRLRVVAAVGLSRLHDLDVHAGVRPLNILGLELDDGCATRMLARTCVGDVDDEWLVHVSYGQYLTLCKFQVCSSQRGTKASSSRSFSGSDDHHETTAC